MFHIPITETSDAGRAIEFCHITNPTAHPGTWEKGKYISLDNVKINVFVKGEFSLVMERERFFPSYGDFCVFPPHTHHYGSIPKEMSIEYYQLDIGLEAFEGVPGGTVLLLELCGLSRNRGSLVRVGGSELVHLCEKIENAIAEENRPLAFALTLEIISKMKDTYSESKAAAAEFLSPRILKTVEYIAENYSSPVSIDSLAESLGVSPSYLSRRFKKEVGTSIHAYLTDRRISEAAKILECSTVAEAAHAVGFCDSSHFISAFKRAIGCTPAEYAKRLGTSKLK